MLAVCDHVVDQGLLIVDPRKHGICLASQADFGKANKGRRMAVSTRTVLDGGWVVVVSDSAWHSAIQATPSCRLQLQVFERGSNWRLQLSSDTLEYCLYNNVFILKRMHQSNAADYGWTQIVAEIVILCFQI